MTILENNCMQSTASAPGYATGSTLVSAIPARSSCLDRRRTRARLRGCIVARGSFFLAALGVDARDPDEAQHDQPRALKFPSGTAAAVTLQGLYSEGQRRCEGARALHVGAVVARAHPARSRTSSLATSMTPKGIAAALLPGSTSLRLAPRASSVARQARRRSRDLNVKLDHGLALVAAGAHHRPAHDGLDDGRRDRPRVLRRAGRARRAWTNAAGAHRGRRDQAGERVEGDRRLGRRADDGHRGPPRVRAAVAHDRARRSRASSPKSGRRATSSSRKHRGADRGSSSAPASRASGSSSSRGAAFAIPLAPRRARGADDVRARARRVPRDRRDRHHADRRDGQDHAAHLRRAHAAEHDRQPDDRRDHRGRRVGERRPPERSEERLPPRREPAPAVHRAARGHLHRARSRRCIGYFVARPRRDGAHRQSRRDPAFPAPAAQQWKAVAEVFKRRHREPAPDGAPRDRRRASSAGSCSRSSRRAFPKAKRFLPSPTGVGLGFILPFYYPLAMFLGAVIARGRARASKERAERYMVPIARASSPARASSASSWRLNNFVLK